MGAKSKEDVLKEMRKAFVSSTRTGSALAFDLDKAALDLLDEYKSDEFPADKFFNFADWRANYNNYVREDEKVDVMGQPCSIFSFKDEFTCVIVSKAEDEATFKANVEKIPHIKDFAVCKIV